MATFPTTDMMSSDILFLAMRDYWNKGDTKDAIALGRAAAPYVHPRPGKTTTVPPHELDICHLSDAELASEISAAQARIDASEIGPDQSA